MASGHIASIRSSARNAQQRSDAALGGDCLPSANTLTSSGQHQHVSTEMISSQSDQLAVISLSDDDDCSTNRTKQARANNLVTSKLIPLEDIKDIDAHYKNNDLHHANAILRLEERWHKICQNLDDTMNHLQDCSERVTESSSVCLQALLGSVEATCDNVDEELKAFYHLMTKCDELTTKLSIASSFRDEIKTLRKSVETLEQLYKTQQQAKTQREQQLTQPQQGVAAAAVARLSRRT